MDKTPRLADFCRKERCGVRGLMDARPGWSDKLTRDTCYGCRAWQLANWLQKKGDATQ